MFAYCGMRNLCAPAEKPPLLDIVDREINALARKAKGLGRIFAGCSWLQLDFIGSSWLLLARVGRSWLELARTGSLQ